MSIAALVQTQTRRLSPPFAATNRLGSSGPGRPLEQATRGYLKPPPEPERVIKTNQTAVRLNFDPWRGECTVEGFTVSYGPVGDWTQGESRLVCLTLNKVSLDSSPLSDQRRSQGAFGGGGQSPPGVYQILCSLKYFFILQIRPLSKNSESNPVSFSVGE